NTSSDTLDQVVNKADTSTTVVTSGTPTVYGQNVTFTATVAADSPGVGTPTGTVQFAVDGTSLGSAVAVSTSRGVTTASYSTTATGTPLAGAPTLGGTYTVRASFAGSTDYVSAYADTTFSISVTVQFSSDEYSVPANASSTTITATLSGPAAQTVTVAYATSA